MPRWGKGKKLTEAARHWASGGHRQGTDDVDEDLAFFGVEADHENDGSTDADQDFPVLEGNIKSVDAFMIIQTQFTPHGLRYAGVEAGLRLAGIDASPTLFNDLRIMEGAVLGWLDKQRKD